MLLALAAVLLAAAPALLAPTASAQAEQLALVSGWFRDREVKYYDFGTNTPLSGNGVAVAPIYVFIHGMNADGTPDMVEGQHNIVDVRPGDTGYSDLWQVNFVTVPEDYEPDSVKSKDGIDGAGFEVEATDMFVNCPIVPEGTTLEGGEPLVQGWYKDQAVFYPDFGANPPTAVPIWVFIHGMNSDGTPNFVEGQNNIIDTVPGQADYSAFWRVNMVTVPTGYEPNSIRSAEDVQASGFEITQTDMVVNCPVTEVAAAAVTGAPSAGTGGVTGGGGSSTAYYVIGAVAALGLLAVGAGLAYARRRR
jgi:cold shock CspA family protein